MVPHESVSLNQRQSNEHASSGVDTVRDRRAEFSVSLAGDTCGRGRPGSTLSWPHALPVPRALAMPLKFAPDQAREVAAQFDLRRLPPEFYAEPYPYYQALREHDPVKRMPDGSWLLTRYDDILPVYRDPKAFSSA